MVALMLTRWANSQSNPTARFLHRDASVHIKELHTSCDSSRVESGHNVFLPRFAIFCGKSCFVAISQMHNYNTWLDRLFCGSWECEDYKTEPTILCDPCDEWTESYRWNRSSSRNNRFETSGKLRIDLEKFTRFSLHLIKEKLEDVNM